MGGALPHCFVGDKAFPSSMDLMRPFPRGKKEKQLPYNKMIFNCQLSRARRIVENAFGILVQSWRVFDRRICMADHNFIKIVNVTCVLHNYLCTANIAPENAMGHLNPDVTMYLGPQTILRGLQSQGYHSTTAAQKVWNIYMDYFNSKVGAVPWSIFT